MTFLSDKSVAITFDDGPSPEITPKILDLISEYNVKASFCVLGSLAALYPDLLKRMFSLNCEIINHSWNHENFNKLTDDEISDTIRKTDNEIFSACHTGTSFVRPPYGTCDARIARVMQENGKSQLFWNSDPRDWESRNASAVFHAVLDSVKDGDVIILHDIYSSTYEAAARIIPELLTRGYRLLTVSEMLDKKGIFLVPGQSYFMLEN